MLQSIARELLARYAPETTVVDDVVVVPVDVIPVSLIGIESYGAMFLKTFLLSDDMPGSLVSSSGHTLLCSIPYEELIRYAQSHGIPIVPDEHDDVRSMLDAISMAQPQTYQSLRKSAQRLHAKMSVVCAGDANGSEHQ